MATILADALRDGACVARGFLSPLAPVRETVDAAPIEPEEAIKSRVTEARIQAAIDETLEYHRTTGRLIQSGITDLSKRSGRHGVNARDLRREGRSSPETGSTRASSSFS